MRQRRHVNGNSNAVASATAADVPGWGSGRTVPANIISSTSKRVTPPVVVDNDEDSRIFRTAKRSGAATARRPQSSSSRDPLMRCRPTRRVQSARGANDKYNQPKDEAGGARLGLQHLGDNTLPKLQPQVGGFVGRKTKSRAPGLGSPAPTLGTDAHSQVQWAVKLEQGDPAVHAVGPSEPAEMSDLRHMLRDRYDEKRSIRQAFLRWDTNKDGRLCVDEFRDMLSRLGFAQALGQKKVDTILQHVLKMPAGSLGYDDFCGFIYGPVEANTPGSSYTSSSSNRRAMVGEDPVSPSDPECVVSLLRAKYESRRIHEVFRDWDIDRNGGVTMSEIESNLRRQGLRIAKPQLMKLFDTYDLNHDGRLLYDEFMGLVYGTVHEQRYSYLAAQRRKKQHEQEASEGDPLAFFRRLTVPEQTNHSTDDPGFRATLQRKLKTFGSRLSDAYAAFDGNHDGNLSYRELCHGLQELGLNLTEREFLHLATRVDADGNGEISFKEFCNVFGHGDASNRRPCSAPTVYEEDSRVEEQGTCGPTTQPKDSVQRRRAAGTFNFLHLTRRTKIPTRCGRTPYPNTKGIISSNQDTGASSAIFTTEAQQYGSGSPSRSAQAAKIVTTLGQEEKQRRDTASANRMHRLRVQMENYEAQARPLQYSYDVAQERRVRTLQRHQERYHQCIEEQRPRRALSPARKGIQISRPSSTIRF